MAQVGQLRKYGVEATINFDLFEVDGVDFRIDAVHATGDTKIMKDEGAEGNTSNGFTDEGQGYSIVLTATEMQAARIVVYVVDQTATKVWLDKSIVIETYGNASAQHAVDLDDAVRAGLTALPNAAADAAGGLPISDAGGLDLDAIDANVDAILVDTGTTLQAEVDGIQADTEDIQARLPAALVGGRIDATVDATGFEDAAVDKVWDEARADHVAAGSFGQMLQAVHAGTAQAGASNQITLAAAASATDDVYIGMVIQIIGGTGAGQSRMILTYNGTSKVATIVSTPDWDTAPDVTSVYVIHAYGAAHVQAWRTGQPQSLANSLVPVDVARWKAEVVPAPTTTGRPLVTVDATGFEDAAVDKIWDEDVDAAHQTAGTAGKKLDDAGAAADPWATALPGAYGAGTAGKIVGDNVNAPIATVDTVVDAIKAVTDLLPDAGALNDLAAILADSNELQGDWTNGGRLDLLLDSVLNRLQGLVLEQGTIGATGNDTTHLHLDGLTYGDDEINGYFLVVFDNSTSEYHVAEITDWVLSTELATVATLPFTPEASVDTYWLLSAQAGSSSAPTAAAVADAVWDEAQADHVAAGSFGEVATEAAAILVDTAEIGVAGAGLTALATQASVDTVDGNVDAILVDTAEIGAAGAGLTAVPWNAAWDAEVESEVEDAVGADVTAILGDTDVIDDATSGLVKIAQDVAAILVDTGTTLDGRIPAALVGGRMDSDVGAKTGNVALSTQEKADVNAEVLDVVNVDTFAEPGQEEPPATTTLMKKLGYLYKIATNRKTQTSTTFSLYDAASTTVDQKSTDSDDGTTAEKGALGTGP